MSTETTLGIEAALRQRLLTFEPLGGLGTVASVLGLSLIHISEPTRPY